MTAIIKSKSHFLKHQEVIVSIYLKQLWNEIQKRDITKMILKIGTF